MQGVYLEVGSRGRELRMTWTRGDDGGGGGGSGGGVCMRSGRSNRL